MTKSKPVALAVQTQPATPGMSIEQYLLTCGAEECAELAQEAIRFGLDDQWPGKPTTPREDIKRELCDLFAVVQLLQANGVLELFGLLDPKLIEEKKAKVRMMMLNSAARGRVAAL